MPHRIVPVVRGVPLGGRLRGRTRTGLALLLVTGAALACSALPSARNPGAGDPAGRHERRDARRTARAVGAAGADAASPAPPRAAPAAVAFPAVASRSLAGGLRLVIARRPDAPLTALVLVLGAGEGAHAAGPPGTPRLAASAFAAALDRRLSHVAGPSAHLETSFASGAVVFSTAVATPALTHALAALGAVVTDRPALGRELESVRTLEVEAARARLAVDGEWTARFITARRRTPEPPILATTYATPRELELVSLDDCRRWQGAYLLPANTTLVIVGPAEVASVERDVHAALQPWLSAAPSRPATSEPGRTVAPPVRANPPPAQATPAAPGGAGKPAALELVDRGPSPTTDIYLVATGAVASSSGRAAVELVARRYCAAAARPSPPDLAVRAATVLTCHFTTHGDRRGQLVHGQRVPTESTAAALTMLNDRLSAIAVEPLTQAKLAADVRSHFDALPRRWDGAAALADELAMTAALDAPVDAGRSDEASWYGLDTALVSEAARSLADPRRRSIVAFGDAKRLRPTLARVAVVRSDALGSEPLPEDAGSLSTER